MLIRNISGREAKLLSRDTCTWLTLSKGETVEQVKLPKNLDYGVFSVIKKEEQAEPVKSKERKKRKMIRG